MDETLLLFTIIVSIILFAPFFFGRIKLPLISSLIIAGVIVGGQVASASAVQAVRRKM